MAKIAPILQLLRSLKAEGFVVRKVSSKKNRRRIATMKERHNRAPQVETYNDAPGTQADYEFAQSVAKAARHPTSRQARVSGHEPLDDDSDAIYERYDPEAEGHAAILRFLSRYNQ